MERAPLLSSDGRDGKQFHGIYQEPLMCMFLHPVILFPETYPMEISKNMVKFLLIIGKHWKNNSIYI